MKPKSFFVVLALISSLSCGKPESMKGLDVYRDIVYSEVNGKKLLLDLYLPKGSKIYPLVIWVHGGGWQNGSKKNMGDALQLARSGFAVASINYRLSDEAIFPAQIIDCKSAVRWLRANAELYSLNTERVGVFGASAGGHLVALMGTSGRVKEWDVGDNLNQSSVVQAVCDWFGPTDFLKMDDYPGNTKHLTPDSPESCLIGGDIRENPEKVKEVNPITYISPETPPFLIMHGKVDGTVIHQQSVLLHDALKKNGIQSELILLENMEHGGQGWKEQMPIVLTFFQKQLVK